MIVTAHIHLWLGRGLLIAGAVQGGLGFLFAAGFKNANAETWPRVLYAVTALVMWGVYVLVGVLYPEFRGDIKGRLAEAKKGQRSRVVRAGSMEDLRVEGTLQGGRGSVGHGRGPSSAPLMEMQLMSQVQIHAQAQPQPDAKRGDAGDIVSRPNFIW